MNRIHKIVIGVALTGSAVAGGAVGASLMNGSANAQTSTTTPGASTTAPVDKSNNDAAHESAETPAHEADETAGKVGHGDHASNRDPAHEAAESPARAAEEASRDAAIANGSPTTGTPGSTTPTTPTNN
jgi:hypothetical protein